MFQVDHEINSYNSLIMNQANKLNTKFTKTYSSSKLINSGEQPISKNKNQLVSDKREINNANLNCFSTDNTSNKNMKNLAKKKTEESSFKNIKKLPKIIKYTIQINSLMDSKCIDSSNTNRLVSASNPSDKALKEDINNNYIRRNLLKKEEFKDKLDNFPLERKNSLHLSDTTNLDYINKILMPSDLTKNKKPKIKKEINFGKMKEYIKLPEFLGDQPLTEILFHPILDDFLTKPQTEKQYEINLYLNSHKMISNLIYLKWPLNKDGTIPTQNIINVKKLKTENKNSEDEEEIVPEIQKEKNEPAPPADADENINLIIPKKRFVSISEYPGNYNKPEKPVISDRQLKFSQNLESKINNGIDASENKLPNDSYNTDLVKSAFEIYKKRTNSSGVYIEKNKEKNFFKDYTNNERRGSKNMNNMSNNIIEDNNINNSMNESIKSEESEISEEKEVQLNTIYGDLLPYYKLKDENDRTLIFESRFESGNLLCAFKTDEENKYQLYLQNDTNTTGYIQWFFFRVTNTRKGQKVNFNIINRIKNNDI